ncbi:MAG TPA: nucleoside monophosphate kinase [Candidatus Saccharimonadales bacterium]|nr:nucleoside monophosphate kinase [Candidatus Saccharimonadales bacterium]
MILIMGLAGSGKGTQGKLLAKKLGYQYLSTGEFLREYITEERRERMAAGHLINDDEMIDIIRDFFGKLDDKNRCILDGFPRSKKQADWLAQQHKLGKVDIEALIYIEVPKAELIKRLLLRGRHDDNEPAIEKRFEEYSKSTSPIIDAYRKKGIRIIEVDGHGPVDDIQLKILDAFNKPSA